MTLDDIELFKKQWAQAVRNGVKAGKCPSLYIDNLLQTNRLCFIRL